MEAIILAGGLGTRLRQVVPDLPKPMAPIAGRPFLELMLARLSNHGFSRIVLSVGYLADLIETHFGASYGGMKLIYVKEQSPLGTGGAIRKAVERCHSDYVYVFNGDTYLELELVDLDASWQLYRQPHIVGRKVTNASRYGRLESKHGMVTRFCEKGTSGPGIINVGCYVIPSNMLDNYTPGIPFSFESDYLLHAENNRQFRLFVTRGEFIDIGVPKDYSRAQSYFQNSLNSKVPEHSLSPPSRQLHRST